MAGKTRRFLWGDGSGVKSPHLKGMGLSPPLPRRGGPGGEVFPGVSSELRNSYDNLPLKWRKRRLS